MLRILKLFLYSIAILLLLAFSAIGIFYLKYQSVVTKTPQPVPEVIASNFPLSSQVNPFIGTGGIPWTGAYNYPGASVPFGVLRLSPETASILTNDVALNTSGYHYGDDKIIGFTHTRLEGTGATDGGHFLIMPADGLDLLQKTQCHYRFNHSDEMAYPGYYAVNFPDRGIHVELTATPRVGVHRYTFSADTNPALLLDITHALGNKRAEDGFVMIDTVNNLIEGHVKTFGSFAGRYGGIKVYFAAIFSERIIGFSILENHQISSSSSAQGDTIRAGVSFEPSAEPKEITIRLAISHISLANALENLEAETNGKSFDDIALQALTTWENRLKSIEIHGGSAVQRVNFYTALYRTLQNADGFQRCERRIHGL